MCGKAVAFCPLDMIRRFPAIALVLAGACTPPASARTAAVRAVVSPVPAGRDAARIGINLGSWTAWGAEQLSANVIKNPGFEGVIDRALIVVTNPTGSGFHDDTAELGRADGFWRNARWTALTGPAAGQGGVVRESRLAHDGLPYYGIDRRDRRSLQARDVVSLTRVRDDEPPTQWWIPETERDLVSTTAGSPAGAGARSLMLTATGDRIARVDSYLDSVGPRAGVLLPVEGRWLLSFWTRRESGSAALRVTFGRGEDRPFVDRSIEPSSAWRKESIEFEGLPAVSPGVLGLGFAVSGDGRWLIDDVDLRRTADAGRGFRREVETALDALRPGYLRDWQGQLGDTLENRLAPAASRRATRYRPGDRSQTDFGYSLPDFLDLARRVGARPWIVVPTTFDDEECRGLGAYLASVAADGFDEIVVEFGNESWNPIFRPAGILDPDTYVAVGSRAFALVREGAGARAPLRFVLNGHYANPGPWANAMAGAAPGALLGVAPYYAHRLSAEPRVSELFDGEAGGFARLAADMPSGHGLAIYEVNAHALGGSADSTSRDDLLAGRVAGTALAERLLSGLAAGVERQCVYTLSGFDAWLNDRSGFARLFGVVRDLGPTGRLRPTGLALSMLNRAIDGDRHLVTLGGGDVAPGVIAMAFERSGRWRAAVVNGSAADLALTWTFPGGTAPRRVLSLDGAATATNEDSERVRITETVLGDGEPLRVAAYGVAVVLPEE